MRPATRTGSADVRSMPGPRHHGNVRRADSNHRVGTAYSIGQSLSKFLQLQTFRETSAPAV